MRFLGPEGGKEQAAWHASWCQKKDIQQATTSKKNNLKRGGGGNLDPGKTQHKIQVNTTFLTMKKHQKCNKNVCITTPETGAKTTGAQTHTLCKVFSTHCRDRSVGVTHGYGNRQRPPHDRSQSHLDKNSQILYAEKNFFTKKPHTLRRKNILYEKAGYFMPRLLGAAATA